VEFLDTELHRTWKETLTGRFSAIPGNFPVDTEKSHEKRKQNSLYCGRDPKLPPSE
jgi:hypothetical protein